MILLDSERAGRPHNDVDLETTPSGGGPPLHFHINDDETYHVLEGRVAFFQNQNGRKSVRADRPSCHAARSTLSATPASETSRMVISTAPAGFDVFFTRGAEEFAKPQGPDMALVFEIAAEHGIHFLKDGARS